VNIVLHRGSDVDETAPALAERRSFDVAAEVDATRSRGGEPPRDVYGIGGTSVRLLPHRIVGRQLAIHENGLAGERTNVIGQHSQVMYPDGRARSSPRSDSTYGRIAAPSTGSPGAKQQLRVREEEVRLALGVLVRVRGVD